MTQEELICAFHAMWDNYPEQVRLIDKTFLVLAGNKAYTAVGVPCESFWVPVEGETDYYIHYTNGLNEAIARLTKKDE